MLAQPDDALESHHRVGERVEGRDERRPIQRIAGADTDTQTGGDLREVWADFDADGAAFWREMDDVVAIVERIVRESRSDG